MNLLKILMCPLLPSFSRSRDHPYFKTLSQTMTVGTHREAQCEDPIR
jgi:hypothetical protein